MFDKFTKQYSLSKTLRFELKPVGETAEYITDFKSQYIQNVVRQDEQRAKNYEVVKPLIDDYHRAYIEQRLAEPVDSKTGELWITPEDFENAFSYFQQYRSDMRGKGSKKAWTECQEGLRKKLVKAFYDRGDLFKKELITRDLPEFLRQQNRWEENREAVESFSRFTTYFGGLHQNRENMYTDEDQATAISNRLMNENLPRFFTNCISVRLIREKRQDLDFSVNPRFMEELGVSSLDEVFQPRYFTRLFTQSDISRFNDLLGGWTEPDGTKIQGLNEQINLYRQKNGLKTRELPGFVSLYKQILSRHEARSILPEAFEDNRQMLASLAEYIEQATKPDGYIAALEEAMSKMEEADPERLYVKGSELTNLSKAMFDSYAGIGVALREHVEQTVHPTPASGKVGDALEKKRDAYCRQDVFSIAELDRVIFAYCEQRDEDDPLRQKWQAMPDPAHPLLGHFVQALQQAREDSDLNKAIEQVTPLLALESLNNKRVAPKSDDDKGSEGFQQVQAIQKMLDGFMALSHAAKPLHLVKGRKSIDIPDVDTGFYAGFAEAFEDYSQTTISLYNKVRNHVTKKPFSKDKIKINFESTTLLNGWDINKETDNKGVLLRRDGNYYLAIMHPKHSQFFIDYPEPNKGADVYEKVNYKLLSGANKMLPKVFFSKKGIETYNPPKEILDLYSNEEHKKGKTFKLHSCHRLIEFFKQKLPYYKVHESDKYGWDVFGFNFSDTETYSDLSDFYREVESQGYKLWVTEISKEYINEQIAQGKLFLFQIYNKDFSKYSKGKPNLHTLFWKGLFEAENLKDTVLKLNGEAEIFFRKHSIKHDEKTVHKANQPVSNKNEQNPEKYSLFDYDIIKDRRYTQDKFFLHVPITLNYKSQGDPRFNDKINNMLSADAATRVIGIDRGERHLLYYTVIDNKGNIVDQGSLNQIETDQGYNVDYQQKLHTKEKERDKARKDWVSVENIKELKSGYLSHVVHNLAKLIIQHNAIVCLEDLNFGFKRGRFKVEKQVYQKFEKALIDKLNYLVFKDARPGEPGHYLNAYQLTEPFTSFEKLGKQSGILFYVPAAWTSKVDPVTGFINFLNPVYESLSKSKTFFEAMDSIRYNPGKDFFEFTFDYRNYQVNQNLDGYRTQWTARTHGDARYQNRKNDAGKWESVAVNVTVELKKLLAEQGIAYEQGDELKDTIAAIKSTTFYKNLFRLLNLTLSLRYSKTGTDVDFILSPVADKNGAFFDSRKATDYQPRDADANGAYHIALKGLWNLQQIRQWDGEGRLNLAMKNADWFPFVLNKPFRG